MILAEANIVNTKMADNITYMKLLKIFKALKVTPCEFFAEGFE